MPEKSSVFKKTYEDYLERVCRQDFTEKEEILGIQINKNDVIVPFFGKDYQVTSGGIYDADGHSPHFGVSVVICKYLLHYETGTPMTDKDSEWVAYRNFKDAAPLVNYFANNTENAIAANFSGRVELLAESCRALGAAVVDDGLSYDLTMQVRSLPRISLYLLFNDADEEFVAECSVLFERRVEKFLDMECVAIVGAVFADYLVITSGRNHTAIL